MNSKDNSVAKLYGEYCFTDAVMKERLPKETYKELKKVQNGEKDLTIDVANVVANAMKDWAIEKGATHFTHWFHPLNGLTAGKHDAFISPVGDGSVVMEFSGKELIKGEPDASSFPNGGLRATFEARGYTAWDTTSPAFLKQDKSGLTLTIPTAFVSYTGVALDKKTPLLRSMEALNRQAMRVLKALGNTTTTRVVTTVGAEQEYFLIDKSHYNRRPDLKLTGRTVFGSMSAKGQEMEDHYFGTIKERVADFMRTLNLELWKLGIPAKTQHNEVAPNQFEIAPVFETSNRACDSNQLIMDVIKKVADRHGLVALLHEKPFAGVNGSGKHNNWSMATDDGVNLLEPGATPADNAQFLLFCSAVIKAVDIYAPILRAAAAAPGNDHRLGANEAPPAIISMFLGDVLTNIFESIVTGKKIENQKGEKLEVGVTTLPKLPVDISDRNRTSPFAFTGNKFEFRMVGSSQSIAGPNVALNTAVAEILCEYADTLEKSSDINTTIKKLIADSYQNHKRIIFNGNGYSKDWEKEAEKRGLPNIRATVYAIPEFSKEYSVHMFLKHKVFSKEELESRVEIYMENYSKTINIEAGVMVEMANRIIFPAVTRYLSKLIDTYKGLKDIPGTDSKAIEWLIKELSTNLSSFSKETTLLEKEIEKALAIKDECEQAVAYLEKIHVQMDVVRKIGDHIERLCDRTTWPLPSYEDLLFDL